MENKMEHHEIEIYYEDLVVEKLQKEKGLFNFMRNRNYFGIAAIEGNLFNFTNTSRILTYLSCQFGIPFHDQTERSLLKAIRVINFELTPQQSLEIETFILTEVINWKQFYEQYKGEFNLKEYLKEYKQIKAPNDDYIKIDNFIFLDDNHFRLEVSVGSENGFL